MRRKINVCYIIGTRPEIIRSAPFIYKLSNHKLVSFKLVHTGQHYEFELSKSFFNELNLPEPDYNLGIGSGSHGKQTASTISEIEKLISKENPDIMCVFGDTNSTLGAAIAGSKMNTKVCHIEAGARSFNMQMAEEINRRLIDHCSDLLLPVSRNCEINLRNENVQGKITCIDDPLYESFKKHMDEASRLTIFDNFHLPRKGYFLLTLHRAENVDDEVILSEIIETLISLNGYKIIFPIHPRTEDRLKKFNIYKKIQGSNIILTKPLKYLEILNLLLNAKITLTESGGLQKEAYWAGCPCITLRNETEWIETVQIGANFLGGINKNKIIKTINYVLKNYKDISKKILLSENPYGKGNSSKQLLEIILKINHYI